MNRRALTCGILLAAGLLLAGCGRQDGASPPKSPPPATNSQAAAPASEDYHSVTYFDRPFENRKKMEIFFKSPAAPTSGSNMLIRDLRVLTFETNGAMELSLTTPECILDGFGNSGAKLHSTNSLAAHTGDGRLGITGTGFTFSQTSNNVTLTISNDVLTTVDRGILAGDTNKLAGVEAGTNQLIRVHADHLFYDRLAGLADYTGNVRAEESRLDLRAQYLHLLLTTNSAVRSLEADRDVVIVDKVTQSRTTADHASYGTNSNGSQLVTLTGHPRWQSADGAGEGTAGEFVFDRSRATFEARREAHFRIPAALGESGFLLMPQDSGTKLPGKSGLADVYADSITLKLPPTNGPVQGMIAERNVVIVDESGGSRATADLANYDQSTGVVELKGNAQWQSPLGLTRAELLTFNNQDKSFAALTNAYLKMSLAALKESKALANFNLAEPKGDTNQFLEVNSRRYDFHNEVLTFHDTVAAAFKSGDAALGSLDCGDFSIEFKSNLVQRLVADRDVRFKQPPRVDAKGTTSESVLTTSHVEIQMGTNGLVHLVTAIGGVEAERTETKHGGKPVTTRLNADRVNALFLSHTNQIDLALADGNVRLWRPEGTGRGDRLVYTGATDTAVLSGQPELNMSSVKLVSTGDIVYDHARGTFRATGRPQAFVSVPLTGTNSIGWPGSPMRNKK